ncbi:hypothetical protein Vretimale_4844 [Volvox reticuliferus]|uniref:Protein DETOXIFICATION n=1 Tax=Volvox reticuliferus TaxID=1737510 RepID=A0A8J4DBN9_9CHLO|nr:hypothetical protein Vretifemale_3463 [Volvox reticuliferus]GIL99697.1 hypothetical protein Vretimale_4844 [Volvox reticuliferus]
MSAIGSYLPQSTFSSYIYKHGPRLLRHELLCGFGRAGPRNWRGHGSNIQMPTHEAHHSRRRRFIATASAGLSIANASDTDPAPDAGGVLRYQWDLLRRMVSFLGPATLIPMGEPLMSLVDTVCIGQFAGTIQLAALGPANLVFSFCQYFLQSLQVATLSLLAGFMRDGRLRRGEELLSTAVAMAAVLGLVTTCILESFPAAIITATGLRDPALLPLSTEYVRVRGLAQPAVLVTMVAQSGLLAQQDSLTPALTVAVAVALSLLGSVVFVAGLGWGLVGAAMTTVVCQYAGAVALLYGLSVRGKLRLHLALPRRDVLWQLLRTMGPLSITYICKNVSYLFIQTTAASLETTKLAAHQSLFAVWNLLAWTVTPFEQAALTYLPGTRGWRKAAGISLLVGLGAAGGVVCGAVLAALVCAAPAVLTRDAAVWPHLQSVAGLASASMLALGADVVASGVNIGMGDARYVAQSYLITLAALGAFMNASRTLGWELRGVWCGVVVFFGVRALQSTGRVLWQHLRPGTDEPNLRKGDAEGLASGVSSCRMSLGSSDMDTAAAAPFESVQTMESTEEAQILVCEDAQNPDGRHIMAVLKGTAGEGERRGLLVGGQQGRGPVAEDGRAAAPEGGEGGSAVEAAEGAAESVGAPVLKAVHRSGVSSSVTP